MNYSLEVESYFNKLPKDRRQLIEKCLLLAYQFFPEDDCTLQIAYQMPALKYRGKPVFYIGNFAKHIGFYPLPATIAHFEEAIKQCGWRYSKGAIQLPVDERLDWQLVEKIIIFRREMFES